MKNQKQIIESKPDLKNKINKLTEEVDFFKRENISKDEEMLKLSKEISSVDKLNKAQEKNNLSVQKHIKDISKESKERGERIGELNIKIENHEKDFKLVMDYFKFKKANLFSVFIKLGAHVYDDERLPIKSKEANDLIKEGLVRKISNLRFDFTDNGAFFYKLYMADKHNI